MPSKLSHHVENQPLLDRLRDDTERRGAPGNIGFRTNGRGRIRLAHASARLNRLTTSSISSSAELRPRLKRIAPMPTSGAMPIAFRTGESVISPEWHAEPVE